MIGIGAQDDFEYALDFVADTGVETPTMLWDPSFATWSTFGVRLNSQMLVMSSDLTSVTDLFYGFGAEQQQLVLDAIPTFR